MYSTKLCLFIEELNTFTFNRIIDRLKTYHCHLISCSLAFCSFLVPLFLSYCLPFWINDFLYCFFFLFPSVYLLCINCRFLLCGYHDTYIKYFTCITVCFTLITTFIAYKNSNLLLLPHILFLMSHFTAFYIVYPLTTICSPRYF